MTSFRGTKRRLDLECESPEPAETLTTDASFVTAEEGVLQPVSSFGNDNDDMTEVSSPAKPGTVRKWTKQVKQLNEDAATFAKAKTLLRHRTQAPDGPSQREQRAQLRAQRLEQRTTKAYHFQDADNVLEDADAHKAAASLVDLMAHEALQETCNDSEAMSQDTGSSADRAFAAAWSRVYGKYGSDTTAPSGLATAWHAQHDSTPAAQPLQSKPASISLAGHQGIFQPQATAADQRMEAAQQPMDAQPSIAAAQPSLAANRGTLQQLSHMAEDNATGEAMAPDEGQMYDHAGKEQPAASASPQSAAASQQPGKAPAADLSPAQQGQGQQGHPATLRPATGDKTGSSAARSRLHQPHAVAKAGRAAGAGTHFADPAAVSMQQAARNGDSELEARAKHLAMQRLVAREAEQQKQDEVLLHSCPRASLVHIPLWGSSLNPEALGQLQGSLAVPASCSVRLLRRIFARAVQVQPSCVQLVIPHGNIALQDFIAGQEASIKQYVLDIAAAGQGLQVQMQLQEGSARVQALIQQEVDLVKQELLSARLRSPATLNATAPSAQSPRSLAGPSVTAVLQSAGWGITSPAKRIPRAMPLNQEGHQLADYEAMLPAQQDHSPGALIISPGRRRVGRWSQAEVAMLITKMEAGRMWAEIRDEWPTLGFPKRSAVDLKDKWRNLEDVVLKGKPTRTVKLTQEQTERIHRCHRKYRAMQAPSPNRLRSPHAEQAALVDNHSMPKGQADAAAVQAADQGDNPSDSYRPTTEPKSSSDVESTADQDGHNHHETSPMTTRSRARQA